MVCSRLLANGHGFSSHPKEQHERYDKSEHRRDKEQVNPCHSNRLPFKISCKIRPPKCKIEYIHDRVADNTGYQGA